MREKESEDRLVMFDILRCGRLAPLLVRARSRKERKK